MFDVSMMEAIWAHPFMNTIGIVFCAVVLLGLLYRLGILEEVK